MGKGAGTLRRWVSASGKTNGELKTQEEVFNEVAVRLQNMPNGLRRRGLPTSF